MSVLRLTLHIQHKFNFLNLKNMKKLFFTLSVVLATVCFASAQLFVEGNLGFSTTGGKTTVGSTSTISPSLTSFNLTPSVGYMLSDDFHVGLGLNIGFSKSVTPGTPETTDNTSLFGFAPFARYYAFRVNKFSLYAQGDMVWLFGSETTKVGSTETDGPETTKFGINVTPGISYDLNDNISLMAQANLLRISYMNNSSKTVVGNTTTKTVSNNFNFGADLDNIMNVGAITIGASFKF